MSRKFVTAALAALCLASLVGSAVADVVYPPNCSLLLTFRRTYPANSQFAGQPYDYVTIAPDATGETFFNCNGIAEADGLADIGIAVTVKNQANQPIVGIPAQEIQVFNNQLCICPGGNIASTGTDLNGVATFTGTLAAGGCVTGLDVYVDGVLLGTLQSGGRNLKTNSPDYAHQGTSPCFTDAGDLAFFATQLGKAVGGRICSDFNEVGTVTIDSSDLAFFASFLGAACQ